MKIIITGHLKTFIFWLGVKSSGIVIINYNYYYYLTSFFCDNRISNSSIKIYLFQLNYVVRKYET